MHHAAAKEIRYFFLSPSRRMVCFAAKSRLAAFLHAGEAIAAVNRTIGLRLEGDSRLAAAGRADSSEELSGATGSILAGITAGLAALRLVLEAALCVELLLTSGEHELVAALFAN